MMNGATATGVLGKEIRSVRAILARLREVADEHDKVTVGNILDAIGDRSYGPALMIPALVELSPIGAIPGIPTFLALIVAISAAQLVIDRDHLWLPAFIQRRSVDGAKLHKAADKLEGIAGWLDKWFHGRLPRLVADPIPRVAGIMIILLTLTVPPLEFIPFASSAPMAAVVAFGLALLVRDGLLMVLAALLSAATFALGMGLVSTSQLFSFGGG